VVYIYIGLCIIRIHISETGSDLVCEDVLHIPLHHTCADGRTYQRQQYPTSLYSTLCYSSSMPHHATAVRYSSSRSSVCRRSMRARCIAAQSLALRLLLARLFALRDQRSEGAGDAQGWLIHTHAHAHTTLEHGHSTSTQHHATISTSPQLFHTWLVCSQS
jgi:hypothetical protein